MPRHFRDRDRKSGRGKRHRQEPRRRILVVCEGKVTEREYLEGYRKFLRNPLVIIRFHSERGGNVLTGVEYARRLKEEAEAKAANESDDNLIYDAVWCVFDVDDHESLLPEAWKVARRNNLHLAISNPCFELWLLLHHSDPPGAQHRDKLCQKLAKIVSEYDKHVDFEKHYQAGYDEAVRRARKLDELADSCDDPGRNPTAGVYRLTELIAGRSVD